MIALFFLLEVIGGLFAAAAPFQVNIGGVSVTFERKLSSDRGGKHKAPPLSPVTMEITARVSSPVENAVLIDYFPKGWTIVDSGGGTVSDYDENYNKIEWRVGKVSDSVTRSYVFKSPKPASLQPKKYHLRSELIYNGGRATGEDWVEISIEKAAHLDENRDFLSDISEEVRTRDGVWSEPIYEGEWVRVLFQKELNNRNDITIYVRNTQGLNTWVEVYYPDSSEKIAEFPVITGEGYYKIYLTNMVGTHDTFDLKIVNSDPQTAYLEFDQIVDPPASNENYFPVTTETVYEGGTDNFAAAQMYSDGSYENIYENDVGSLKSYNPAGYNLLGNTKYVSGGVGDLGSDDNSTYLRFRGYPSAFAGDVQVAESEAESTTTSTTYQDKATLTWTPSAADNYLIIATAEIKRTSTTANRTTKAQLTIDGTSVAETFVADDTDVDIYRSFVAFKVANLTAASHTIKIQYATTNTSNTATIKNARIIAMSIGNNFQLSEPSNGTTTSTTYTDIATLSFTPEITENWLILAHADVTNGTAANYNGVLLLVDGENRGEFWSRQANANHYLSAAFHDVVSLSGGSSHTIKIQMKTSAGTLTYKNVHLYAIPISAVFREFFAENSDSLSSTTSIPPGTTKTTLTFTPTESGDYLFLATGQINTSSTTVYVGARLTINGTDYGNSIVDVAETAQWPTFTISKRLTGLSGGQTATISFYTQTAGTTVYIRNARLIALRLPTASEYRENVEFTGTSNTEQWSNLTWTVDSQWTTDSVNVILQLYNYSLGRYAESGEDGYLSYTSGAANTDQTQTQTITTNPTNFRDASGNWKIRVSGVKGTSTRFDLKVDWIEFKPRSYAYRENVQHNITGIPFENFYDYRLEIGYYLVGDSEPVSVYLYNFSTGLWENIGNLTSTTYTVFTYNITENQIDNVNGEVRVRYVQPDNDIVRTSLMLDYAGVIAKQYEWNLIETWTATVRAPSQWNLIETWAGTVRAPSAWNLIDSWTATVRAPAQWNLIESWSATITAPAQWRLIESWSATVRAPSQWNLIETWTATVSAPAQWHLIDAWTATVRAPSQWNLIETWTATVRAPAQWNLIESWTATISAPAEWHFIETWSATISAPAEWHLIESWTATVQAPGQWNLIETWSATIAAPAEWHFIESWTATVRAPAQWHLIESWTGTVRAPTVWNLIESWTGTVKAPAQWHLIDSWSATIAAPAEWHFIESWSGTVRVILGKPILLTPANGEKTNDDTPTFTWIPALNAENHRLLVSSTPDFSSIIENRLFGPTDNSYTPDPENYFADGLYYWKVVAINFAFECRENESDVWEFRVDTTKPGAPTPVSPPQNATIDNDDQPLFTWTNTLLYEPSGGTYTLIIDNDSDFSSPIYYKEGILDNEHEIENKLTENFSPYYWKVRAVDNAGNIGDWSSRLKFTLKVPPSSSVDAISPYWQRTSPLTISATATDNDGAVVKVELWYRYSPDNSSWSAWNLFDNDFTPPYSWSFTFPDNNGYYEFYTRAWDDRGNYETPPAQADARCGFDNTPPAKPTLVSPENNYTTTSTTPTFRWTAVSDLSGVTYELLIDNEPDFAEPYVYHKTNITDNQHTCENALDLGYYYWRVRAVDNAGNYGDWAEWYKIEIVPYQWNLIETWTGTVKAPAAWSLIESWTGTVKAPLFWNLIESWSVTVRAPAVWNLIESWTAKVSSPAEWHLVESWTGSVSASAGWNLIESWTVTVSAPGQWKLIESWAATVQAPGQWNLIESWTGTVRAPVAWNLIESWTATVQAPAQWHLIESWTATVRAPAQWHLIESWTGTVRAPTVWNLIETWAVTVRATSEWNLIETWTATISAPAQWHLIESWTAMVRAPSAWNLIESWTATVRAPVQWNLIESWTATISAPAQWYLIESWTATVQAPAQWHLVDAWTATIRAPLVWSLVETWTATIKAPTTWNHVESWTAAVRAPAVWQLVEVWSTAVRAPGIPSSKVNAISPFWVNAVPFTITATASDPSGVDHVATVRLWYRHSTDKLSWSGWENFGDNTGPGSWSFTAPEGDGYYEFYSIAVDKEGYVEPAPVAADASCGVDTSPPVILLVVINDGATTTSSTSVKITIAAFDATSGVAQMQFSNDGLNWTDWEAFSTTKQYLLQAGSGLRTVYVRVRDNAGLISAVGGASIELLPEEARGAVKIASIPAGMTATADLSPYGYCITGVTITARINLENVIIKVEQANYEKFQSEGKVSIYPPSGIVYHSFWSIESNVSSLAIASVRINFRIDRSWVEINRVDERTIVLYRFVNGWQPLPTVYTHEDETCFYYEAISPGLSVFAAVGERKAVIPVAPIPPTAPPAPSVPQEFFTMMAMAGGLAAFSIIYSLTRPSRYFILLRRLEKAVTAPKHRIIGKPAAEPEVEAKIEPEELEKLKKLQQAQRKKLKKVEK